MIKATLICTKEVEPGRKSANIENPVHFHNARLLILVLQKLIKMYRFNYISCLQMVEAQAQREMTRSTMYEQINKMLIHFLGVGPQLKFVAGVK